MYDLGGRDAGAGDGSTSGPTRRVVVGDPRRAGAGVVRPRTRGHLHARRYRAPSPTGRLLVWVHGGPTSQWDVAFLPGVPFWTSRGWDVLLVDPRGSTGHGRAYQQALRGGWGRLDVDDTAAMVRHAHDAGWGEPGRTVVMGGSSGGLAVLAMLGHHDDLVAGGVALYPVSDIADLSVRSHRFELHYNHTLVGPDDTDEQRAVYRGAVAVALRRPHHGAAARSSTARPTPSSRSTRASSSRRASARPAAGSSCTCSRARATASASTSPKAVEYRLVESFLDRVVPAV